jgi:hypothetical protein
MHRFGDLAVGECSRLSDVKMGNSLDELKRERFHTLDITSHYKGEYPEWIFEYASNTVKKGVDCCSEQTITFHYSSDTDMKRFSNLTNPRNISEVYKYY